LPAAAAQDAAQGRLAATRQDAEQLVEFAPTKLGTPALASEPRDRVAHNPATDFARRIAGRVNDAAAGAPGDGASPFLSRVGPSSTTLDQCFALSDARMSLPRDANSGQSRRSSRCDRLRRTGAIDP